jgi:glycine cleavage system H protein
MSFGGILMIEINEYKFDESLLYYAGENAAHIWLKKLDDGTVKVGFDDFGQKLAGKILFVRTMPPGKDRKKGKSFGNIETGKYVGPLRSPVTGTIKEINPALKDNPGLINDDPYGEGWVAIIQPENLDEDLKEDFIEGVDAIKTWIEEEIATHVK